MIAQRSDRSNLIYYAMKHYEAASTGAPHNQLVTPTLPERHGSTNAYRYVGEYGYYRDLAAVQYVRARWLAVGTGRWLNAQAANRQRGSNPFAYGQNKPNGKVHLLDGLDIPICAIPCVPCSACLIDAFLVCRSCKLDLKCWARCLLDVWRNLPAWVKFGCGIACGACVFCLVGDAFSPSGLPLSVFNGRSPTDGAMCLAKWGACNAACSECSGPLCCGGYWGVCCHKFCRDSYLKCIEKVSCEHWNCDHRCKGDFAEFPWVPCQKAVQATWSIPIG